MELLQLSADKTCRVTFNEITQKVVLDAIEHPRDIDYVEFLPKTFSGKIKRDLLRKHAETGEMWSKDTK